MKQHKCSMCVRTFKKPKDFKKHNTDAHDGKAQLESTGPRRYDGNIASIKTDPRNS